MISQINGILIEKQFPTIIIDIHGIGYEIDISMHTFYALPDLGEKVHLYTHLVIREDAHLLYGFLQKNERSVFKQLIKISGIGAKTALGILSALTVEELSQAITQENLKLLSSIPGIGKKTAERMILELRGKLTILENYILNQSTNNCHADVLETLLALGYSEREARITLKHIPTNLETSEGVRLALKNLIK